jgi:hypothetical protein
MMQLAVCASDEWAFHDGIVLLSAGSSDVFVPK